MIAVSETAVRAMLDAYAQAWGQFDIEAIAEHVALPCVVERDHRRTFIEDDAALMEALAAEVAAYRDAGGAIASVESIGPLVDLGDGEAWDATLGWRLDDTAGRPVAHFGVRYTIAADDHGPAIVGIDLGGLDAALAVRH